MIVIICNPAAKKASEKKLENACRYLRDRGHEVESFLTRQRGEAELLARDLLKKNPSLVLAAGGDGTFNEVMNGLAGSVIPMAILPLGTTNVLAKELGVPEHAEHAVDFALSRYPHTIALGRITLTHSSPPVSRYFCLMAGIGFDGAVVHGVNETLKKFSGKGAYIFSGFKTLFMLKLSGLQLTIDGKMRSCFSVLIGNVAKYGGNFSVTPDADIADPALSVCFFQGKRRADVVRYVLGILWGRHLQFHDVSHTKATALEVRGSAHIQIDGDYLGMTPATIEIVPNILRLVY
ncbi:MAG: diacylglycerol kinase family lipid kinase [Thermodesulfovibrionales bacterium]|nr:diacylglycerol kinase family lipid kinase [Thermodesulfovibrionales bacterium]